MSSYPIEKDLTKHNTMALPCVAEKFYVLQNDDEVAAFFKEGHDQLLVLGGGSNLILPPVIKHPVVQLGHDEIVLLREDTEQVVIKVGAAVVWDDLVAWCVDAGYYGIENLSLIPGSVGAAPVQNIGAYGVELRDVLVNLRVFDRTTADFKELDNHVCCFGYRDSIFKRDVGRFVITEVTLRLSKKAQFVLSYGELKGLERDPDLSLKLVRDKVIAVRSAKLPDPACIPNTGSFFKNPIVSTAKAESLKAKYPDLVCYPVMPNPVQSPDENQVKLAAGWLIDNLGLKGYTLGEAAVHDKQALVLTNRGVAQQADILALARRIKERVSEAYGIDLEQEPITVSA